MAINLRPPFRAFTVAVATTFVDIPSTVLCLLNVFNKIINFAFKLSIFFAFLPKLNNPLPLFKISVIFLLGQKIKTKTAVVYITIHHKGITKVLLTSTLIFHQLIELKATKTNTITITN